MTGLTEIVRNALGAVFFRSTNFPEAVQGKVLGQDMAPLRDKATDAVVDAIREAWIESTETLDALYADGINRAAEQSPLGHPLPEAEIRAVRAGVDVAVWAYAALPERIAQEIETLLDNSEGDDIVRDAARLARGYSPLAPVAKVVDEVFPREPMVLGLAGRCLVCAHETGEHAPLCEVGLHDGRMCGCSGSITVQAEPITLTRIRATLSQHGRVFVTGADSVEEEADGIATVLRDMGIEVGEALSAEPRVVVMHNHDHGGTFPDNQDSKPVRGCPRCQQDRCTYTFPPPGWAGEDQMDACRCDQRSGHDGGHTCSHTRGGPRD